MLKYFVQNVSIGNVELIEIIFRLVGISDELVEGACHGRNIVSPAKNHARFSLSFDTIPAYFGAEIWSDTSCLIFFIVVVETAELTGRTSQYHQNPQCIQGINRSFQHMRVEVFGRLVWVFSVKQGAHYCDIHGQMLQHPLGRLHKVKQVLRW